MAEMGVTFEEVRGVEEEYAWLEKYQPGFSSKYLLSIDTAPLRRPLDNTILNTARSEVLSRLLVAVAEVTELSARILAYEVSEMNDEYEKVGQQARAAKKAYDQLTSRIAQHEEWLRKYANEYNKELSQLNTVQSEKPNEWNFPTRQEKAKYEQRLHEQMQILEEAKSRRDNVNIKLANLQAEQNDYAETYNTLAKRYSTFMNRLAILRGNDEKTKGKKVQGQYLFQR